MALISVAPLPSSTPVFPGPSGQPQTPGHLPSHRDGDLEAGGQHQWHRGSWLMSIFITASPCLMTVSSNKIVSKQGEFSVFIAAIEKIM